MCFFPHYSFTIKYSLYFVCAMINSVRETVANESDSEIRQSETHTIKYKDNQCFVPFIISSLQADFYWFQEATDRHGFVGS